jgi:hypothetical protein
METPGNPWLESSVPCITTTIIINNNNNDNNNNNNNNNNNKKHNYLYLCSSASAAVALICPRIQRYMPPEDELRGIQYEIQCEKDGHERTYLREQLAEAKLYIVNLQETLKLKGAADAVSMPPIPLHQPTHLRNA